MLGSRFPMMLGWGPDLLQFYNDAYVPVLGVKHPALGVPVRTVWAEIWDVVGPLMHSVLSGGPALWREHQLLFINSRGFSQETFHTFSQSPVPGDDGKVGGVLLTVQETTEQVQGERQLETLRALAERSSDRRDHDGGVRGGCLGSRRRRRGRSLLARLPARTVTARRQGSSRRARRPSPALSSPASSSAPQTSAVGLSTRCCARVSPFASTTSSRRFGDLPGGRYGVTPDAAVVFPLFRDEKDRYGFVVFGLEPVARALRSDTSSFLGLIATQLVSAIARARASEEERRRAEAMAELDRAKTLFFSNISHELRTPLTLMLGPTTDALLSPSRTLEGQDLEVVHRNALRLQKLVGQLARLRAHRGRARTRVVGGRPARRSHQGDGEHFRVGDARGRPRVRGPLRGAFRARPDRSGHVGEDPAEPDLERLEVHLRRSGAGVARRSWRPHRARGGGHGHWNPRARAPARLRSIPSRAGCSCAHAGRVGHRAGAGARARAAPGRLRRRRGARWAWAPR